MARQRQSKPRTRSPRLPPPSPVKPTALRRWQDRIDRPLEILICIGHIAAIVGLLADHLS